MNNSSSPSRKKKLHQGHKENHLPQTDLRKKDNDLSVFKGSREINNSIKCVVIEESQKNEIIMKMSPDSIRIFNETKWNEKGFIPSFNHTDKVLREASRRAYKTLGISDQ